MQPTAGQRTGGHVRPARSHTFGQLGHDHTVTFHA